MASFLGLLLITSFGISSTVSRESSDRIACDKDFEIKVFDYMVTFSANLASFSEKLNSLDDKIIQLRADSEHTKEELTALKTTISSFGDGWKDSKVKNSNMMCRLENGVSDDISNGNESVSKAPTCTSRLSNLEVILSKVDAALSEVPAISTLFSNLEQNVSSIQTKLQVTEDRLPGLSTRLEDLEKNVSSIQGILDASQEEVPTLNSKVEILEQNVSEFLTILYSSLSDLPSLKEDIVSLKKNMSDIKASVGEGQFRKAKHTTEVSFESWMRANFVRHPGGANIIFNNIKHNIGDGYSALTGLFTAPVPGLYLFWAQVEKRNRSAVPLYMMQSGRSIGYYYAPAGGYGSGTVIATTRLKVGETVYVATPGAETLGGRSHSKFGGTLLLEQLG